MRLIGFDIGGTKCAVSLAQEENGELQILKRDAFLTLPNWRSCVEKLFLMAESLLDGSSPDACGFSCGGPLDADRGIVLSPPNLPGWDRVPLVELARERFHVPCTLENDANACALAEWRWGAGRGSHDMVFLTFGTGLGAGIIMNDQLIRGANGNAGEVGHVRLASFGPSGYGKAGSFEGFCSGGGIAQLGETLAMEAIQSGKRPSYWHEESAARLTAKDIADAARDGDRTALRVFQICGEKLGYGLSAIVDILNPEVIVLGSIFVRCEQWLRPYMERVMKNECLDGSLQAVTVAAASLGERIGDYAALSCAMQAVNKSAAVH